MRFQWSCFQVKNSKSPLKSREDKERDRQDTDQVRLSVKIDLIFFVLFEFVTTKTILHLLGGSQLHLPQHITSQSHPLSPLLSCKITKCAI